MSNQRDALREAYESGDLTFGEYCGKVDDLDYDLLEAYRSLLDAAKEFGMCVAGIMPLDQMKTDYFKDSLDKLREEIVWADEILRAEQ